MNKPDFRGAAAELKAEVADGTENEMAREAFVKSCGHDDDGTPVFNWQTFIEGLPDGAKSAARNLHGEYKRELTFRGERWAEREACNVIGVVLGFYSDGAGPDVVKPTGKVAAKIAAEQGA